MTNEYNEFVHTYLFHPFMELHVNQIPGKDSLQNQVLTLKVQTEVQCVSSRERIDMTKCL